MTSDDCKYYPALHRLVVRHENKIEQFQTEASEFFHPYAVKLCKRIRKGIPSFEGCQLVMRRLFLNPMSLMIPISHLEDGKWVGSSDRLGNVMVYLPDDDGGDYKVNIITDAKEALMELDKLADYIDDNYSMVGELCVDLSKED